MANIYELTAQYKQLSDALEQGEDTTVLLDKVEDELEQKADNYARIMRNFEGDIAALKAEEKRLKDKRGTLENAVKRLKETLQTAMIETDKRKFKTDLFSFTIAKNGGALPVIVDVPTEDLADEFVIITEKPDLDAIRKYIQETGDITQFHLGERGESLRIK